MNASTRANSGTLEEGRNCWRIAKASRVALLVDSDAYFRALHACLLRARRSIYIVGWELDPRTTLLVEGEQEAPAALAPLLKRLLEREARLEVRILRWDYLPLRFQENLLAPISPDRWPESDRFRLHVDGTHAPGASHHQKIVVVDDRVAFCGGMDLTWRRWDTPEHRADDPRRVDRRGEPYNPWHDVQLAVEGEAASALGELVRERWHRAVGDELEAPVTGEGRESPWPTEIAPDIENTPVGVSRTIGAFENEPASREIEALYVDAIAEARHWLYIENQYLTSKSVGDALADCLEQRDGPEVVIVVPSQCAGWLEDGLMTALRVRLLNRLEAADRYNRLRTYYPFVPGLGAGHVDVHSKLLVVDDRLISVGSANVSNRSMTVDTEANLTIEAGPAAVRRRRAIARLRNRLIAEHLDVGVVEVERRFEETQSLIRTIDGLATRERTLAPLSNEYPDWIENVAPSSSISDPERPVDSSTLVEALVPTSVADVTDRPLLKAALGGLLLSAALAWRLWRPTESS